MDSMEIDAPSPEADSPVGPPSIATRATAKKKKGPSSVPSVSSGASSSDSPTDRYLHHVYLPYILSGYLQLAFNVMVISFVGYIMYSFLLSVHRDIDMKATEYSVEAMNEISLCRKNYLENRCQPETRVPAMALTCTVWESCMNRDPSVVARTKVSAQTLAEIVNSFCNHLSYQSIVFLTLFLFGFVISSNLAFQFSRSKMPLPHLSQHANSQSLVHSNPSYHRY
eukprot:TRINITY_DN9447_c0_g1_i1.p1 TRINITY_DN9447_c0_g1~~TRINITY_DN9447_c0_g1_i1.p1  ORF type:complete len:225 (-),score=48.19 TRINITY_DN9447_c0_g1_i1:19-693(-)